MREDHFLHHANLKTDKDPEHAQMKYKEFSFPLSKPYFAKVLFLDLIGFNFFKYRMIKLRQDWSEVLNLTAIFRLLVCFGIALIALYFNFLWTLIILWLVPYVTVFQVLNRIRLYTEHNNILEDNMQTRSVLLPVWIAFFLSPYNLGYHSEHHLYPSVPFYNLKELHKIISGKEKNRSLVTSKYMDSVKMIFK
jgi:fatty acid desaturase